MDVVAHEQSRPAPPPADDYQERIEQVRAEALAVDPVLVACDRTDEYQDATVVDAVLLQLAKEAAALGFDRREAERRGSDRACQIASRRVASLASLASLVCLRARVGGEANVDPRDPKLQKIVVYFEEVLAEAATEALGEKLAESFLAAYRKRIAGWEDRIDPPRVPRE